MQRILLSLGMIVFVGALAAGATGAFFSDTETSTGNTFAAGSLDLRVDSEAHYNGSICTADEQSQTGYSWQGGEEYPVGLPCVGTWEESDLDDSLFFRFFDLEDIKPGDEGENTISLHVYDNDAWGRFLVTDIVDADNTCTEPEGEEELAGEEETPGCTDEGELAQSITFSSWLDQGATPGFQCNNPADEETTGAGCEADPTEGDNIQNGELEVLFWEGETVDDVAEGPFELAEVLAAAYEAFCVETAVDGHNGYGTCHGLAEDGRMVGSTTYYFGLGWSVPGTVGNEAQTDSLTANLTFEVEQHRNNPTPFQII